MTLISDIDNLRTSVSSTVYSVSDVELLGPPLFADRSCLGSFKQREIQTRMLPALSIDESHVDELCDLQPRL